MAIVLAFRIGVVLGPPAGAASVRIVKWAEGPGVASLPRSVMDRLHDPAESDEELTVAVSAAVARVADVATFEGAFETRKLHVLFGRTPGGTGLDDDAMFTIHFAKLAAGAPVSEWLEADFTAIEAALDTWWGTIKARYPAGTILKQFRWYAAGPQIEEALGGPGRTGPPRRVVDRNVAGTNTTSAHMPPQVAVSVTERTSDRSAWGRYYLPAPGAVGNLELTGRIPPSVQAIYADAGDALYETAAAASTPAVVYSTAKPARETAAGTALPARGARILTVDTVQVDDVYDVIRSRRWKTPLLRLQRGIGA